MSVVLGDCVEVMRGMPENSIDSIVCDPPYGLAFMGKDFDQLGNGPAQQAWHLRWSVEALRVLKPGGHLIAFGGTRTYHRLTCAVEDAGFEIRDCVSWFYGTGFPKAKSQLKPAHEPAVLARKPGPIAELAIDSCRIEYQSDADKNSATPQGRVMRAASCMPDLGKSKTRKEFERPTLIGRYPTNIILDEEAGAVLDAQSGFSTSPGHTVRGSKRWLNFGMAAQTVKCASDSGGASRFFYCPKASKSERGEGNTHPTVKPIALMGYLARLVTQPGGTVLDPFMGSGSTGLACKAEGFGFVGIEKDPEYFNIAIARLASGEKQD